VPFCDWLSGGVRAKVRGSNLPMRIPSLIFAVVFAALVTLAHGAITISGIADKTKYNDTVTFTVTADPLAASTTATLDDLPITVGSPDTVTAISYHELKAESRDAGGGLVDSKLIRFIVRDNAVRGDTESGIPPFTPYRTVNDAPSAFSGQAASRKRRSNCAVAGVR